MKEKVYLGLSGGVDSAVSAHLLKEEGYEVIALTFLIWGNEEDHKKNIADAKSIAKTIEIEHQIIDLRKDFEDKIISYFISEYENGRTPNPCIFCNPNIKWKNLLSMGALIATGHYAKIIKKDERYTIEQSKDISKDQSYMLSRLSQEQLAKTLMPLANFSKDEVRKIAKKNNISVYNKKDSQEICFIPDNDYISFLEKRDLKNTSGDFLDLDGNKIGEHDGVHRFTIGQRKGLGMSFGKTMFVNKIDSKNNAVYLASNEDLFLDEIVVEDINFMAIKKIVDDSQFKCKIRYAHKASDCVVKYKDNKVYVKFSEKQRAITKGQAAVFYKDNYIVFAGTIK